MAVRLEREAVVEVLAGRETIGHRAYVRSEAHDRLGRELARYLEREISGRSFLIAGHRGAGKTALVRTVIDEIVNDIFKTAERNRASADTPIQQRPLLVKLHGPSLLGEAAAPPETQARNAESALRVHVTISGDDATPAAEKPEAASATLQLQSALVQITIALYRALSAEVTQGFALAAQEAEAQLDPAPRDDDDCFELPSQLRLDLDSGADPALLRDYWSRLEPVRRSEGRGPGVPDRSTGIGRLQDGVLWPGAFRRNWPDRGYREIAALATAGQAFRICTGAVTASQRRSDNAERSDSIEVKGGGNFRSAIDRLFALGAGAGVGLAVHGSSGDRYAGAAAGLLGALASLFALNWSSSRSLRGERAQEYSFLPDLSVQSLDRDLPLVIERIREIGLAPVFVVDEIDKIASPDEPIGNLMRRLKQLTADFGFFCFLTDRDYFERLKGRLGTQVFSLEHTYFAHRMLVAFRVEEIAPYLRRLITTSLRSTEAGYENERFAALVLGRVMLHRSELNMTELSRQVAAFAGPGGTVVESDTALRSSDIYRLEVLMQLSVEQALRSREIAARIAAEPSFSQVAADALYLISRAWREKNTFVDIRRPALERHLRHRMRLDAVVTDGLIDIVSDNDLAALAAALAEMGKWLCNFERFRKRLEGADGLADEDRPLLTAFEPPLRPLLRPSEEHFIFQWDCYGLLDPNIPQVFKGDETPALVVRVLETLGRITLTLDDLVAAGLLPETISAEKIVQASVRVGEAAEKKVNSADAADDIVRLLALRSVMEQRSSAIGMALALTAKLRNLTGRPGRSCLLALRRYMTLSDLTTIKGEPFRTLMRKIQPDLSFDALLHELSNGPDLRDQAWSDLVWTDPSPFQIVDGGDAWQRWREPVTAYLAGGDAVVPASRDDLVLAAQEIPPGSIFRYDLSVMTRLDWSRLTLEGATSNGTPGWAVIAGLLALGFDQGALRRAGNALKKDRDEKEVRIIVERLVSRAPPEPADQSTPLGRLEIIPSGIEDAGLPSAGQPPILQVHEDDIARYDGALRFLQSLKLFGEYG